MSAMCRGLLGYRAPLALQSGRHEEIVGAAAQSPRHPRPEQRMTEERVIIAGAGPVGLVAAAHLVRHGIPVTVLEAGLDLSAESRASTFHPATLDMLDEIGAATDLIAEGLKAPKLQYRSKRDGVIAEFDFGAIADATRHPYRLQAEQCTLTRILYRRLREDPCFRIEFGASVRGVEQDANGVRVEV